MLEYSENPEKFNVFNLENTDKYPPEIEIYGTIYNIERLTDRKDGLIVYIIDTPYEIYEDRCRFSLSRIEDGIGVTVANNLESLSSAIQLAEIYERCICFQVDTEQSLELVDDCLQFLRENLSE